MLNDSGGDEDRAGDGGADGAEPWLALLVWVGAGFTLLGAALGVAAYQGGGPAFVAAALSPEASGPLGGAFLVAAAGLVTAALLGLARQRRAEALAEAGPEADPGGAIAGRAGLAGWPQAVASGALALLAAAAVLAGWRAAPGPPPGAGLFGGAILALAAFPVLVLERLLAGLPAHALREAESLHWLQRVPLAALLLIGGATSVQALGPVWPVWVERAVGVLVLLVAAELAVRALAMLFLPFAAAEHAQSVARSALARLIQPRLPGPAAIGGAMEAQFGIDLTRSWALGFVWQAAPPVALGTALLGWGLSGLVALQLNERAIYERLGVPVEVLGPGLHLRLPWPLGVMRRIERGTLHDIPVTLTVPGPAATDSAIAAPPATAEAPAPPSADRLWDQVHPSEATYLVASQAAGSGRLGFQAIVADLRVVYRIGLDDDSARAAAYRVEAPERLLRGLSGRLLARYFAAHTLPAVLGENRAGFTAEFRAALQAELDALGTGLEVTAVIVEAIHPPQAAAGAYHAVQAAEIKARLVVAEEHGALAKRLESARTEAVTTQDEAEAAAAERVGEARAEQTLFAADRAAWSAAPASFLLDRRLQRLQTALARARLLLLDPRLADSAPTLDLRDYAPPAP